jgi:hypothetical protein
VGRKWLRVQACLQIGFGFGFHHCTPSCSQRKARSVPIAKAPIDAEVAYQKFIQPVRDGERIGPQKVHAAIRAAVWQIVSFQACCI